MGHDASHLDLQGDELISLLEDEIHFVPRPVTPEVKLAPKRVECAPCLTHMRKALQPAAGRPQFSLAWERGLPEPSRMFTRILRAASATALAAFGLLALGSAGAAGAAPEAYTESPGTAGDGSITIGPDYAIDPDLTDRGNPKGQAFEFTMRLADSKIFRGDDPTLTPDRKPVRKERRVFVYVPAAYRDGAKAPVLVTHDGPSQMNLVRNALDNLTISKDPDRKLPPFIVVAVENGGNDGKKSERGLEYDTMSDRYARFINDEVFPAVLTNATVQAAYPHLAITENPWGRATMGCSSGGAAALTMGWFRPDLFRRVIAYSGTFVAQQDDDAPEQAKYRWGAWEYHSGMQLIQRGEKKPLRIFTHVSENDLRPNDAEETRHNWVMAGLRTAAALKEKGYSQRFLFSRATAHCDRKVFEQTLADTLVWVWRGYHGDE